MQVWGIFMGWEERRGSPGKARATGGHQVSGEQTAGRAESRAERGRGGWWWTVGMVGGDHGAQTTGDGAPAVGTRVWAMGGPGAGTWGVRGPGQ